MTNSVLEEKTQDFVYRDGKMFLMTKEFLVAEVMMYRSIMNEVYHFPELPDLEFYPQEDAEEIIAKLWDKMIKDKTAYIKTEK
jgi:hypothetical protein